MKKRLCLAKTDLKKNHLVTNDDVEIITKDFDNLSLEDNFYDKDGKNICQVIPGRKGNMVIVFNDCLSVDILGVVTTLINVGYKFDYYDPPLPAIIKQQYSH